MEWEMLGKRAKLYGVAYGSDQDSVKLGRRVWTFVCDPSDGYRSYCEEVRLETDKSIGPFFVDPVATVTVREWTNSGRDYQDSPPDGFELVDNDGHVWLTVGTDHSDDYYPSYTFGYTPKEAL